MVTGKEYFEEWRRSAEESAHKYKLPETIEYGYEVHEGDSITGCVVERDGHSYVEDGFYEGDDIIVYFVRRPNGQLDIITHDGVYMNAYPTGYSVSSITKNETQQDL